MFETKTITNVTAVRVENRSKICSHRSKMPTRRRGQKGINYVWWFTRGGGVENDPVQSECKENDVVSVLVRILTLNHLSFIREYDRYSWHNNNEEKGSKCTVDTMSTQMGDCIWYVMYFHRMQLGRTLRLSMAATGLGKDCSASCLKMLFRACSCPNITTLRQMNMTTDISFGINATFQFNNITFIHCHQTKCLDHYVTIQQLYEANNNQPLDNPTILPHTATITSFTDPQK